MQQPSRAWLLLGIAVVVIALSACFIFRSEPIGPAEAIAAMRETIREEIDDPAKADAVLALVDRMDSHISGFVEVAREHRAKLRELNARYDTSREEFVEAFETSRTKRRQIRDRVVKTQLEMREMVSADEWSVISERQVQVLRSAPGPLLGLKSS